MSKQPNPKGATMAEPKEMAVREKKELAAKAEKTVPGRYFVPAADIYETDDALAVVMEMPGVEKKDLEVALENDVLRVFQRLLGDDLLEGSGFLAQVLNFVGGRRARRVARQTPLPGFQEFFRPGVIKTLSDALAAAKFRDAVLAAQAVQDDADLLLG